MDLGLLLVHLEVGERRRAEQLRHVVGAVERLLEGPEARRPRSREEVVLEAPALVLLAPGRHRDDTPGPKDAVELGCRTSGVGQEEQRKGSREYVEPVIGEVQAARRP